MKNIHSIEFYTGSKEELLPGFEKDFPYIASRAELDKYIGGMYRGTGIGQWNFFIWKAAALNMIRQEEKYCFLLEAAA